MQPAKNQQVERKPLQSREESMAMMPRELISIILTYVQDETEKLLLIAIFPYSSLIYFDKEEKRNDSIENTVRQYLDSTVFERKSTIIRLLEIVTTGVKNPALMHFTLDYALGQLDGLCDQLNPMQKNNCGMNTKSHRPGGEHYDIAQKRTTIFFNFVTKGYFPLWIKTKSASSEITSKYITTTSNTKSILKKCPTTHNFYGLTRQDLNTGLKISGSKKHSSYRIF